MKKFVRILSLVLVVIMMFSVLAFAAADTDPHDVNDDGRVDDDDVREIMERIATNGNYLAIYDIRPDDTMTINILDAIALKLYSNGLILNATPDNWTTYWY